MQESHFRSLMKAVSWRIFGTVATVFISYLITHKITFAIYIGLVEFIAKIICFYFHERMWSFIPFGLSKANNEKTSAPLHYQVD
jgi:adenylylsulfate kinase